MFHTSLPKEILRAEGDAWVDAKEHDHIVIKNRKNEPIHALTVKADEELPIYEILANTKPSKFTVDGDWNNGRLIFHCVNGTKERNQG